MPPYQISHKGVPLFYGKEGNGPVVMLLHGFGEDQRVWNEIVHELSTKYTVIFPAIPGSGDSPFNPALHSIDDFAESLEELVQKEAPDGLVMIGHSMGGYITLAFAEKHAEKLHGFGLFHSTALADSDPKKEGRKKSIQFIEKNGADAFLKQATPGLFTEEFREKHPDLVEGILQQGKNIHGATLIRYYQSMIGRPDRTKVLKESTVPVLFVLGKKDEAVPFSDTLPLVRLPSISYTEILESSAHMGMLEEKERALEALEKFLGEIPVYKG